MQHHDDGALALALDEFQAAYDAMPDPRGDREGRELVLGDLHATLLDLHDATAAAAPLCRLADLLLSHADALTRAYPDTPNILEIRSARARRVKILDKVATLGQGPCPATSPARVAPGDPASITGDTDPVPPDDAPPGRPVSAAEGPAPAAAGSVPAASPPDAEIPPRHLRIAGGVTLGLGVPLLGVMTYALVRERQRRERADDIAAGPATGPRRLTADEHAELLELRGDASARALAIGTGVAAATTTALGVALLVLARRHERASRVALAPWWSTTGAGLTLLLRR
jgi:hypothetical protein